MDRTQGAQEAFVDFGILEFTAQITLPTTRKDPFQTLGGIGVTQPAA